MKTKLNLNANNFDDIIIASVEDYEEITENYTFLPNVDEVKKILQNKVIAHEGTNWVCVHSSEITNEIYEELEEKNLFPYFCYDYCIDDFK